VVSAVIQTAFLGDMVLTTPLLTRLASQGPVHVVATPPNAGILANHPAVASVIVFDKRKADRGIRGLLRVARALRRTGASTVYLAQGSVRSAAIARFAGIRERVSFDNSPGRVFATRQVRFDKSLHHAQRLLQLASPAGSTEAVPALRPSLYPSSADHEQVDALLTANGVNAHEPLLALAPGSVWATKRWPSFDALAAEIASDAQLRDHRIVVIGGPGDTPLATEIVNVTRERGRAPAVDATGKLSLLASTALLSRARVLVTNDSAPLHLASAMNTPTVAVFGPTIPAFGFGPLSSGAVVVENHGLPCRPCHAHGPQQCPLTHWRCMRDVSASRVLSHVQELGAALPGQ
jgi:heptosyltransferase-2